MKSSLIFIRQLPSPMSGLGGDLLIQREAFKVE